MAALHTEMAETENRLWYNSNRNLGKLAGGLTQPPAGRFCKPCNNSSHRESQCWGECGNCSKRGHRTEWFHSGKDLVPPTDPEQAVAEKKKKKKAKKVKKVDLPPSGAAAAAEIP